MNMNEKGVHFSAQMYYDIKQFVDSLECDRGSRPRTMNVTYEDSTVLRVNYNDELKRLVIDIYK